MTSGCARERRLGAGSRAPARSPSMPGHLHVEDRQVVRRLRPRRRRAARSSAARAVADARRLAGPRRASCGSRISRLVALSSTTSTRARRRAARAARRRRRLAGGAERHGEPERACRGPARSRRRSSPPISSTSCREIARPEPGAAVAARGRAVGLGEGLEQARLRVSARCRCRCRAPRSAASAVVRRAARHARRAPAPRPAR